MTSRDYIYDIETYMDIFCAGFVHAETRQRFIFEVSSRVNQSELFCAFLARLGEGDARLFGYNNIGFDWTVCDHLLKMGRFDAIDAHRAAQEIFDTQRDQRFSKTIWPDKRLVRQGDLFLIHHFDNKSKSTGLKKLEINMKSHSVVDLPFPPDQPTTWEQKDTLIRYMCHDISETLRFYDASRAQIEFRDDLAQRFPDLGDVINFNDTKIGKQFFIREIEKSGTPCYEWINGKRGPRQTRRDTIALRDVISPRVGFRHEGFQRILSWLQGQVLSRQMIDDSLSDTVETKGVFKGLKTEIDGFTYHFGTGGIHGSISSSVVRESDEYEVWDWDVASYYPNLAIANRFYPAHLSEAFCTVYERVYHMRSEHKKGTAINEMLKLALNGVYGDSNNKYGPFYDPQYTMSITINGQLMLCMLAEWLTMTGADISMIQINTDGLTLRVAKGEVEWMKQVCQVWQDHTGLKLESAQYKAMFIRDVNSYIAVKRDGKVKRIGAYAYETWFENPATRELQWHKDHSMRVVQKAAEAQMVHGIPVTDFITRHRDPFDFQLSVKVPRNGGLLWGAEPIQNTTRFYVSTDGKSLTKTLPPLKGKETEREFKVHAGWTVTPTNDMAHFRWDNVNWLFYIEEANKLVIS